MIRALQLRPFSREWFEPSRRYYIFVSKFNIVPGIQELCIEWYRNKKLRSIALRGQTRKEEHDEYVFPLENSQTIVHRVRVEKFPFFFARFLDFYRILFINGGRQRKGLNSTVLRVLLMLARGNSTKPLSSATLIPPVSLVSHPRSLNFAPLWTVATFPLLPREHLVAVQLRAVAETFIARRVKFHDGFLPGSVKRERTRRETAPIYPRPEGGYPISSCFLPTLFSPSVFSSVSQRIYTHSSKGERIDSRSKIGIGEQ